MTQEKTPRPVPFTGETDATPFGPRVGAEPVERIDPEEIALGRFTITALLAVALLTSLAGLSAGLAANPSAAAMIAEGALLVSVIPVVVTVLALWTRDPVGALGSRGLLLVTIIVGLVRPVLALFSGALGRFVADYAAARVPITDIFALGADGLILAILSIIALVASREQLPPGRSLTLFERAAASLLVSSHSLALVTGWLSYAAISN